MYQAQMIIKRLHFLVRKTPEQNFQQTYWEAVYYRNISKTAQNQPTQVQAWISSIGILVGKFYL
jgi:hypothetical protein